MVVPTWFQTYFVENPNNHILFAYDLTVYGLIDYVGQSLTVKKYSKKLMGDNRGY